MDAFICGPHVVYHAKERRVCEREESTKEQDLNLIQYIGKHNVGSKKILDTFIFVAVAVRH